METIRKTISKNAYTNRLQGLLPYVEDGEIVYPSISDPDGNYGKLVCDLVKTFGSENSSLKQFFEREEGGTYYYRYRYINMLADYLFILKEIREGKIVKRITKNSDKIWVTEFDDIIEKYEDYKPYDLINFTKNNEYQYSYSGDMQINDEFIILVNDSEKIKKINKKWCTWFGETDTTWNFMQEMDNYYVGVLNIPYEWEVDGEMQKIEGVNVPREIKYSDVSEWLKWFDINEKLIEKDCCIKKEWNERGGDAMRAYLKSSKVQNLLADAINKVKSLSSSYRKPYASFNIALDSISRDSGLMTIYEDEWYIPKVDTSFKTQQWLDLEALGLSDKIESKLDLVRRGYSYDDNGLLPGYLIPNTEGKVYHIEASNYGATVYYEYEDDDGITQTGSTTTGRVFTTGTEINGSSMMPVSKRSEATGSNYINLTIIEQAAQNFSSSDSISAGYKKRITKVEVSKGSTLSSINVRPTYLPSYGSINWSWTQYDEDGNSNSQSYSLDNSLHTMMVIPYITNEAYNVSEGYGDYVNSITYSGGKITIDYTIGGNVNNKSQKHGYTLRESYDYDGSDSYTITLEGSEYIIGYQNIKTEYVTVHSEDLGLDREAAQADLTGILAQDLNGITKSILFKRGATNGLNVNTVDEVDIEIDRGDAAAFEHYYKLSECNTMEDLENYGNNYFNL